MLTSQEALDLLSALRLGIELGLARNLDMATLNRLMLTTQPGHLQKTGSAIGPEERDQVRARIVRETIRAATVELA